MQAVEPQVSRTQITSASGSSAGLGFSCKTAGTTATYRGYPRRVQAIRPELSRSRAELRLDSLAEADRDDLDAIGRLIAAREAAGIEHLAAYPQIAETSWALPAERRSGPCWASKQQWLAAVSASVLIDEVRALMAGVIKPASLRDIAAGLASFSDAHTGRGVTASNTRIGKQAAQLAGRRRPYSERMVTHARTILKRIGLAEEAARGRYLTIAERMAAVLHHGTEQRRAASVWNLIMPAVHVRAICDLPRSGSALLKSPSRRWLPTRARARAGAPTAQQPSPPPSPARSLRSRQAHTIVAHLIRCCPSMDKGHLGALVDVITCHVDTRRWTARDLIAILDATGGLPATIARPARYLEARLTSLAGQLAGPSPSEQEKARAADAAIRRQRHRTALARDRARAATPAQRRAHKARIDAQLHALRQRQTSAKQPEAPTRTPGQWKRRLAPRPPQGPAGG